MRHWAMGVGILGILLAGMTAGCEGDSPPDEATQFDPAIDAAPTNLAVAVDRNLVADQPRLARELARTSTATTQGATTGPAGAPEEDAGVKEVRQIVTEMATAAKAGEMAKVFQFLNDEDRVELDEAVKAFSELPVAMAAFNKGVKETLGMKETPASLTQALGRAPAGTPGLAMLGTIPPAELTFKTDGTVVTVTGAGLTLKFSKPEDAWLLTLDATDKKLMAAFGGLLKAQIKMVKALSDGIKDGAITEHNLDEKGMALLEELVKPEIEKLKDMGGADEGEAP